MSFEPPAPIHLPPVEVAPETFVLRSVVRAFGAPLTVSMNSMVLRGMEPVVVDTGICSDRLAWLADVASLVDPAACGGCSCRTTTPTTPATSPRRSSSAPTPRW